MIEMKMAKVLMFLVISLLINTVTNYVIEKVRYISTEHPKAVYTNPKYLAFGNVTARRYGRNDPFYYVGVNLNIIVTMNNNVTVSFYFYEFLSNTYRRGFVEMNFKLCDLLEHDTFFGEAMRMAGAPHCPVTPGIYRLQNMTIPLRNVPHNFPFTKGRIYCNATVTATKEPVANGYIDMEIKEARIKKHN